MKIGETNKMIDNNKLQELKNYDKDDKVVASSVLQKYLTDRKGQEFNIKSTLYQLDKIIDGFQEGELTIISGEPKSGKTLFCQTLTMNFARQGIRSVWFTFEVGAFQFLKQFGSNMPLFFLPMKLTSNSLAWIEQRIVEAILKYKVQVVFIDHLHFLIDMQKSNISLEIGKVVRFIKTLANKYSLCIFLVAHIGKTKTEKELDYDDIRDSSFVSQESDNTFMIWRSKKEKDQSTLKVCLNRRLGVLNKTIKLIKVGNFLGELIKEEIGE